MAPFGDRHFAVAKVAVVANIFMLQPHACFPESKLHRYNRFYFRLVIEIIIPPLICLHFYLL